MSTIDTKLLNLNIWEGTTAQIESAIDAGDFTENDLGFLTDVSFEEKFRYTVMPRACREEFGNLVQYIGETDENFTQGRFYRCTYDLFTLDTTDLPEGVTAEVTSPSTFTNNVLSLYYNCHTTEKLSGGTLTLSDPRHFRLEPYFEGYESGYIYSEGSYQDGVEFGIGCTITGNVSETTELPVEITYKWEEVSLIDSVDFQNVTGDPNDNAALVEEFQKLVVQVTELPEITADNKDKVYQYVGETDIEAGLYKGCFYKTVGYTYEVDTAKSQLIDNISLVVTDTLKFDRYIVSQISTSYPDEDSVYLDIVFSGHRENGSTGYNTTWWIDPDVDDRDTPWLNTNEYIDSIQYGMDFGGTAVITDESNSNRDSPNTRFRFVINKVNSLASYRWTAFNPYVSTESNSSPALVNKSWHSHSIIESKSADNRLSDADYNTIIGVGSQGNYRGYSTIYGADNYGSATGANGGFGATVVGSQNHTITNFSVLVGNSTISHGEYGVCIGSGGASVYERAVAIGERSYAYENAVAIGSQARAGDHKGIAIGLNVQTTGAMGITLGSNMTNGGYRSIAIGVGATIPGSAKYNIQLGDGYNANDYTLQVGNYTLLDFSEGNGYIPHERLAGNTPEDGYALTYDKTNNRMIWTSVIPEIPEIQYNTMPAATDQKRVVQYIGDDDGTYVCGYFYKETYDRSGRYWYWKQIDTQPSGGIISYNDIIDKPMINGVTLEGDLDLVDDLGLPRVAATGSYADLTTKPGINGHPLLANTSAAELEISYNDLTNKPMALPSLPSDSDQFDYVLRWDHTLGTLVWDKVTAEE